MDLSHVLSEHYAKGEVLTFYRRDFAWGRKYRLLIEKLLANYVDHEDYVSISEYKGVGDLYVDLKQYDIADYSVEDLDIFAEVIDLPEIMTRERAMRIYLSHNESYDLIVSCTKYFIELFRNGNYRLVVGQMVDNYVMDIMVRVGRHFGVTYVGIVQFFYKGYVRITTYGEYNYLRETEEEEVNQIYTKMISKEKTLFSLKKKDVLFNNIKYYLSYKAKYALHFIGNYKILRKREYDFWSTKAQMYPKRLKNFFTGGCFIDDLKDLENSTTSEKRVYIPLHFYPEATTEYWVDHLSKATYYPSLYATLKRLSAKGYEVIVKEHPAMFQKRDKEVYRIINSIDNVYLASPFIPTDQILELVEKVVVWTGTSGIEAIMQDKKVTAVSKNYYNDGLLTGIDNMNEATTFSDEEKVELIKKIMQNCIKLELT